MAKGQVQLDSVSKSFGALKVIDDITLSVADGDFVVLLGPSGCGKSTLLRMIAGLETVSDGDLSIGGMRVNEEHPSDRNIAMVFQNYALYPHMSIKDNIGYPLKLAGIAKAQRDAKILQVAKLLELQDLLGRKPAQLSGGQRQRVAMGRALVRDPMLFLMDEPLSNLDARLRQQMRKDIKALHEELRVTTLYVTHDQVEAMTMADQVVLLDKGKIQQIGSPKEIYNRPENLFVAKFIGNPAMNIIEDVSTCRLFLKRFDFDGSGSEYPLVGLRPENIGIAPFEGVAPTSLMFEARVEQVEMLGSESLCHLTLQVDGGVKTTITSKLNGDRSALKGERVQLSIEPLDLHLFERATGRRL